MGAITAQDLDIPTLDLEFEPDREIAVGDAARRGGRELDREEPVRVLDPALRRRRRHAARQALAQRDVADHGDVGHHRPAVPQPAADVDPVRRGRRAHPPAAARRQGVLAAGGRPAAPVHARRDQRPRRRRRAAGPGRHRRRHLRAVPDPDHLRAARRAEGGLEAVQPLGHRRAAHLQRQPPGGPADDRRRPGRARRVHARPDRRSPVEAGRRPADRPHRRRGGGRQALDRGAGDDGRGRHRRRHRHDAQPARLLRRAVHRVSGPVEAARRAAGAGPAGGRGGDALLRRGARHGPLRQRGHRVPGRAVPGRDVHRPVDGDGELRPRRVRPAGGVRHHPRARRPAAADVRLGHPLLPRRGARARRAAGGTADPRPPDARPRASTAR